MDRPILAHERFSFCGRHFYLDYRVAVNQRRYLSLACVDERQANERTGMRIFQSEITPFVQAISSLIREAAYCESDLEKQNGLFKEPQPVKGIKSWQPEVRPREKLMLEGREVMTDAELLAMLICAGLPGVTAVDLADAVLEMAGHELHRLATFKVEALMKIRGIGHARALSLISAMELAIRLAAREQPLHYLKVFHNS